MNDAELLRQVARGGPADRYDVPQYDYRGKVAIVTGAGQGVGRHAAFGLARCGAKVVLAGRSDEGQETAEQTAANYDGVFAVNVRGLLLCMKHEIRAMRKNEPPQKRREGWRTDPTKGETQGRSGYGRIVNVGSAAAFVGFSCAGIYIARKHAVHGLTQTAAIELAADTDIRVNMVVPGSIKTHNYELFTESQDEMKKLLIRGHATKQILLPEDCVPAILFLCSDGAFFSVGQLLFIDGGFTAQ